MNLVETFSEFKEFKNIDRVTLMNVLEEVVRNILKKKYGTDDNFDIIINPDKGDLEIWRNRIVVADGEVEEPNQEIELSALEYSRTYNVSEKIAYRDLSNAVDALMHRVITTDREENKKGKRAFTLMSAAEYKVDEGKISCEFNYHVIPHLIGMRERFSSYPLREGVEFSSSYTWRFYEILASWSQPKSKTKGRFMGWIDRQSVEELRSMMGVPTSYTWQKFQTRVMETAQKELWEKSNISVTFERVKTGRKITHLNIKFIEDDQQKLPLGGDTKKK